MPLGLGLGISKLKSLVSGLRVRFQGNATITAALDGILRDLSADFVSNGTVTAALETIKLLDVDFIGDGTLTADLASFEALLDLYPNAAAAYSIRLLKSDYTGALVRIRRSSDNAEKDFYPDSNFELSLSSEDGASTSLSSWISLDNGFVSTIYDQSGNNNNYTQSNAAKQGQIITSGSINLLNNKPVILSGGSSAYESNYAPNAVSSKGYFYVGKNQGNSRIFSSVSGSTDSGYISQIGSSSTLVLRNVSASNERLNGTSWTYSTRDDVYNDTINQFLLSSDLIFSFGDNSKSLGYLPTSSTIQMFAFQEEVIFTDTNNTTGKEDNINNFFNIY